MTKSFPIYRQYDQTDCGPACLRMIAAHYGKDFSLQTLRDACFVNKKGISLMGLRLAAESIGFEALAMQLPYEEDTNQIGLMQIPLPCIAHWQNRHFIVVYKINSKFVWVADPEAGKLKLRKKDFEKGWYNESGQGTVLALETTPAFYAKENTTIRRSGWRYLFSYLRPYRKLIIQLCLGLLLASIIQLILPFLAQALVDIGIENQDIHFIYLILIAQLALFIGQISTNVIQAWILLHIGTRINISLISDFLKKLTRLPLRFFDQRQTGDLMQRISDHSRIEDFLTGTSLTTVFAFFSLIVFSIVLLIYHPLIFSIFLIGSILYILWITFFLKRRRIIDYQQFEHLSDHQNALLEIIRGMPDIKLQGSENARRQQWKEIQLRLFKTNLRYVAISQYQDAGANLINQIKNILISFTAALAVVKGQMTLGMLLAVQYIVGQMNGPLAQMIHFMRSAQDAAISLDRFEEVHHQPEEKNQDNPSREVIVGDIKLHDISFRYSPVDAEVLSGVDLNIPHGKTTAIVGESGSGKSTLLKLLLGFYLPTSGTISINNHALSGIAPDAWRQQCGAVMQGAFLFSDTISNNITEGSAEKNNDRIKQVLIITGAASFIAALPNGIHTEIGPKGIQLSEGQRQRILIARALYKNPEYLFFDEATNALDASTEKKVLDNLNVFFENRTVVIVAHRLSTIRNADQIIVMDNGKIIEMGSHKELIAKKGTYFTLIQEQT